MANTNMDTREDTSTTVNGKPLQRVSWKEKIADNYDWFKQNIKYYCGVTGFTGTQTTSGSSRDIGVLYDVYNNQFPMGWFDHITNPLNAANPAHKKYPAKIRPTSMLRTNIDLLLGEYPQRPFSYTVSNLGEDGYNIYLDGLRKKIQSNIEEHFLAVAQQAMAEAGHETEEIPQDEEIPIPEEIKERFNSTYKDNLAIRGQRWMKRAIREYSIRREQLKMFKDWLIAGSAFSYKNMEGGNFVYERVPAMELRADKSPNIDFIEDGEWAVRRTLYTLSDTVDKFYDELTDAEWTTVENRVNWTSPQAFLRELTTTYGGTGYMGKVPVYHCQWKGRKKIIHIVYTDPLTGQSQELTLDEDTPIDDNMYVVKKEWVNEVYEGWMIGEGTEGIMTRMRAVPVQRNQMNNFSTCKLSYNGRNYSDTHSQNVSPLEMGIPKAIMYMVIDFVLEKTIAKNKGKIALIDQATIPKKNGWTEEKFFYYADALGYMLIDRNQQGVDKSFNQYTTLDMSLFGDISNLIQLRDTYKQDWDDLLGITPQRKAQVGSSDGKATTEQAIFRSTLMTDQIFNLFEEFTERDLQGILDYSKFINVDGIRAVYNEDEYDKELLDIDPNSYCSAELGLFVRSAAEESQVLNGMKQNVQALIQNGVKMSTIFEVQRANGVEELMGKLKYLEEIETRNAQASADDEHQKAAELEEIKARYLNLQSTLKINEIDAEYDRKEGLEMVKGEYMIGSAANIKGDMDADNNGVPDAAEIGKRVIAQQKMMTEERSKNKEIASREKIHKDQMALADKQLEFENKALKVKEKTDMAKVKAIKVKAKSSKK